MFHESQNEEYLNVCIIRAKEEYLAWVEQFLDIIEDTTCYDKRKYLDKRKSLNDIGCNLGQFWKGLKKRHLNIDYNGYDIEPIYIRETSKIFPEIHNRLYLLDITRERPKVADVSVMSAILEHLDSLSPGLDNILQTTEELFILRTFLGDTNDKSIFMKEGAKKYYYINQYSFLDILELFDKYGFDTSVVIDKYTESMPKYLGQGIVRTQYIIIGKNKAKS